mgnify:CR=1 FL=1
MTKLFKDLSRKGTKRFYWVSAGILLALFITFAVLYAYRSWGWLLWAGVATVIIWSIMTFAYIATA